MAVKRVPEELWRVLHLLEGRKIIIYSVSLARSVNIFYSLDWFPGISQHSETHKICSLRNLAGMFQKLGGNNVKKDIFVYLEK